MCRPARAAVVSRAPVYRPPMTDTDEVRKLKDALVAAEEALEDSERGRLSGHGPVDYLVAALWAILPAEAVADLKRAVNERALPIPRLPSDTERALRLESENRLAEIQVLTKALREEEQARKDLQAQLGVPSIIRNVKSRCHSCGAEFMTADDGREDRIRQLEARVVELASESSANETAICTSATNQRRLSPSQRTSGSSSTPPDTPWTASATLASRTGRSFSGAPRRPRPASGTSRAASRSPTATGTCCSVTRSTRPSATPRRPFPSTCCRAWRRGDAAPFGVGATTISAIKTGTTWAHVR